MQFVFPTTAIVKREFMENLRRARTFYSVLLLLSLAVLITTSVWPADRLLLQEAAAVSQTMIMTITVLLFYGCALIVPALGAASIVSEREQDTFDLLYLTLIRPRSILLGKLFNTCGVYMLVVAAALPVYASALFAVGLDTQQLLYSFVLLLMLAAFCGTIGIVMSTVFKRGVVALVASYVLIAILMGGPKFLFDAFFYTLNVGYYPRSFANLAASGGTTSLFTYVSPAGTALALFTGFLSTRAFALALLVQMLLCTLGISFASRRLRRQAAPKRIRTEKVIDDVAVLEARRKQFPYYLIDPSRRRPTIEDGRNPMLVREIRWGLFARGTTLVRVFYVTITVFGFLFIAMTMFVDPGGYYTSFAIGICLELLALVSFAPIIMANAFTKERELGNIDMLRMTLLKPRDVVRGKAIAGVLTLAPLICAIALASVPVFFVESRFAAMVFAFYITMPVCAALAVSLSLLISLMSRYTRTAITAGILLNAFVFLGFGLLVWWSKTIYVNAFGYANSFGFRQNSNDYLPFVSLIGGYYAAFSSSHGPMTNWILSQFAYLALAALLLKISEWIFRLRHMRDV